VSLQADGTFQPAIQRIGIPEGSADAGAAQTL
jgi:hypothetical protein